MTNLQRRIVTGVATTAMLLNAVGPAFAATTIVISGNGSDTENEVKVERTRETTVVQENKASVVNEVDVDLDTGDNSAEDNTGGSVEIDTGDTDSEVVVGNSLNSNEAQVDQCDCDQDVDVLVEGNGTDSENEVELDLDHTTEVFQENTAKVRNDIDVSGNTGDNEADDNTNGDVAITTGDNDSVVGVSTTANANAATVGGEGDGGTVSAVIRDNGSDTDNEIELGLVYATVLSQANSVRVLNNVDVEQNSGDNTAEDNTGGEVAIDTGDTDSVVEVDNLVNFNGADIDCDCVLSDLLAKVVGNGTDSENEIKLALDDSLEVYQENMCRAHRWPIPIDHGFDWPWHPHGRRGCLVNDVDVDGNTGENGVEDSTLGNGGGDPTIETGDAQSDVAVSTSGNANVFGDAAWDFGDVDLNLNFSLNLEALLALLGLL